MRNGYCFVASVKVVWLVTAVHLAGCTTDGHTVLDNKPATNPLASFINIELTLAPYLAEMIDEKRALADQLSMTWGAGVSVVNTESAKATKVTNCQQFFSAESKGMEPVNAFEFFPYRTIGLQCIAISLLSTMNNASKSYLGDFSLDLSLTKQLPTEFAFIISSTEEKDIRENSKLSRWSDVYNIESVESLNKEKAVYKVLGGDQELTVLARGDFNHDNIEDILVRLTNTVTEGSYTSTRLFLLTKLGLEGEIRLLKAY